jgi:hypothetical protein
MTHSSKTYKINPKSTSYSLKIPIPHSYSTNYKHNELPIINNSNNYYKKINNFLQPTINFSSKIINYHKILPSMQKPSKNNQLPLEPLWKN